MPVVIAGERGKELKRGGGVGKAEVGGRIGEEVGTERVEGPGGGGGGGPKRGEGALKGVEEEGRGEEGEEEEELVESDVGGARPDESIGSDEPVSREAAVAAAATL
jgi:hypothetical protein